MKLTLRAPHPIESPLSGYGHNRVRPYAAPSLNRGEHGESAPGEASNHCWRRSPVIASGLRLLQQDTGLMVGQSESRLLAQWGPPTSFFESGGVRYLTYSKSSSMVIPGTPPTYHTTVYGNTAYTTPIGGTSDDIVNFSCTTTFTIQDGMIRTYRWQGNNCC